MAEFTYRGWSIAPAYVGWEAVHPDYDGPEDNRALHSMSRDDLYAQVDDFIADCPERGLVQFNVGSMFAEISSAFERLA